MSSGSGSGTSPFGFGGLDAFLDAARPECVITGCGLSDGLAWNWGDLHRFGGVWIFHGASHTTTWLSYDSPVRLRDEKALIVEPECSYFERRGVFVLSTTGTRLNARAQEYLNSGRKAR